MTMLAGHGFDGHRPDRPVPASPSCFRPTPASRTLAIAFRPASTEPRPSPRSSVRAAASWHARPARWPRSGATRARSGAADLGGPRCAPGPPSIPAYWPAIERAARHWLRSSPRAVANKVPTCRWSAGALTGFDLRDPPADRAVPRPAGARPGRLRDRRSGCAGRTMTARAAAGNRLRPEEIRDGPLPVPRSLQPGGHPGSPEEGAASRIKAVAELTASVGGRVEAAYWAFGEDDFIMIAELPDNAAARGRPRPHARSSRRAEWAASRRRSS